MTRKLSLLAFILGLATTAWMATTFIHGSPLALLVTLLIAAVFIGGFIEIKLYQSATTSLNQALSSQQTPVADLSTWLGRLDSSLQNSVRLRIEGEHIGLPTPVLTPYLVGLLVMLGLLGTFVGMVETLKGAVLALEGNTELEAIREGLAAPIQGLGMAFGTSVAGVAASAMLGFASTLSRRQRLQASRLLDSKITQVFQQHSLSYNRQQTYQAMQAQAQALPAVAERLNTMADSVAGMSENLAQQLADNQKQLQLSNEAVYRQLAESVEQSLKTSLAQAATIAGESIRPSIETMTQQVSAQVSQQQQQLTEITASQLASLSQRVSETSDAISQTWQGAVSQQQLANSQLSSEFSAQLEQLQQQFHSQQQALQQSQAEQQQTWLQRQQTWLQRQQEQEQQRQQQWQALLSNNQNNLNQQLQQASQAFIENLETLGQAQQQQLQSNADSMQQLSEQMTQQWQHNAEQQQAQQQQTLTLMNQASSQLSEQQQASSEQLISKFSALLASSEQLVQQRIENESNWLQGYQQRLTDLTESLSTELSQLRDQEAGHNAAAIQRLGQLEQAVASHLSTLGNSLEAPMNRLLETAAEAPKAAAEVIAKLRAEISSNIERDNAMLEERQQMLQQLQHLANGIADNSAAQLQAITELSEQSGGKLDQLVQQFGQHIDGEVDKLNEAVEQFSGSTVELASLGDAFSHAVQLFHDSNQQTTQVLEGIQASLQSASSRSDEQLAYYVAQAREVIDHSMLSQQEIIQQIRDLTQHGVPQTNRQQG